MALAPVVPLIGAGRGQFQPITAEDVAACVMATLPGGAHVDTARNARFELAGPEILDQRQIVTLTLEALRRPRPLIPLPQGLVRRSLKLTERLLGEAAFATWDEAQLMTIPSLSARGSADVESLGITPASMATALGIAAA
jgi:NADH dehydrogenase